MKESKEVKKALWLLVGIPMVAVLILLGMLVYEKYVDNNEVTNNKIQEQEENKQENQNEIDLVGYTEIDISKNNIYPIYKTYEVANQTFSNLFDANYLIENNKLYIEIENEKYEINIQNPKKVIIGEYDNQISQPTIYVLTTTGKVYTTYAYNPSEFKNLNDTINQILSELNENIKETDLSNVDDISAVSFSNSKYYGNDLEIRFVYTSNDKKYVIYPEQPGQPHIKFEDIYHPELNINTEYIHQEFNVKVKYLLEYISETGHGAFLDEDNYLYVSTYKDSDNIKKGRVVKAYDTNNERGDIVVQFEDGTLKNLSEYYDW